MSKACRAYIADGVNFKRSQPHQDHYWPHIDCDTSQAMVLSVLQMHVLHPPGPCSPTQPTAASTDGCKLLSRQSEGCNCPIQTIEINSVLSHKRCVVLSVQHNLGNGANCRAQADEQADEAHKLQDEPLGAESWHTCSRRHL